MNPAARIQEPASKRSAPAKDLNYGGTIQLQPQLIEVSKLLEACASKILASEF